MRKNFTFIHPFVFTLLPPLILFSENVKEVVFKDTIRSFLIVELLALLLFIIAVYIYRNVYKASFAVTASLFFFFSYFHFTNNIPEFQMNLANFIIIGRHKILFPLVLVGFISLLIFLYRLHKNLRNLSRYLFIIFTVLVAINTTYIVQYKLQALTMKQYREQKVERIEMWNELPDVYYIILDGYGRQDVLTEYYNFNNNEFIQFLKDRDFHIATQSAANYPSTYLSIASSLNMEYLDNLVTGFNMDYQSNIFLRDQISNNRVLNKLKKYGYTFVTFSTGYEPTDLNEYADIYYYQVGGINYFEYRLLNNTLIRRVGIFLKLDLSKVARERFYYNIEKLKSIPEIREPTFTFIHLLQPHPPFIFDEHGNVRNRGKTFNLNDGSSYQGTEGEYREGYIQQLKFINRNMQEVITTLLKNSEIPPIVILQSDHGPGMQLDWNSLENTNMNERMSNFTAVFGSEKLKQAFYSTITPVNIFRTVFREQFAENMQLLEDKSYFSLPIKPFKFYRVINNKIIPRE